jgi:serine/threonine-protein kinase
MSLGGLVHADSSTFCGGCGDVGRLGLRHDFVKVLDFGLVKSVSQQKPDAFDSLATASGIMPGTPAYMAPEMAIGEQVDGRADIYALGCVAWFLRTGRPVFETELGIQAIARHLNVVPDPPSRHAAAPVPEELDRVVLACLAKKPDERPQTATILQQMLRQVPGERWSQEEAVRWWAAHRTP